MDWGSNVQVENMDEKLWVFKKIGLKLDPTNMNRIESKLVLKSKLRAIRKVYGRHILINSNMRYNVKTIKIVIYWIWLFSMFDEP